MSGNSLSLTNTRDGTFNNLYIINDNGQVENIKDLIESGSLDQATIDLINSKAPKESPTFTGTVNGITKTMVGLGNVDNTSDSNKPISTATQTALNGKANLTAPTFTGDITVNKTGDNGVNIRSETGSSSLFLQTNNLSNNIRMAYSSAGLFQFRQNNTAPGGTAGIGVSSFEVYPNGVLTTGNKANNKTFVLFENGLSSDDPSSATNFYGFGYNTGLLRYQAPIGNSHKFFCGATEAFALNGVTDAKFLADIIVERSNLNNDVSSNVRNTATTGTSSIYLKTNSNSSNSSKTSRLYLDETGSLKLNNNSELALEIYPNNVFKTGVNRSNNKVLVLHDNAVSDAPLNATNFFGFGINTATLRYQVPDQNYHRFYCGSVQAMEINFDTVRFPGEINGPVVTTVNLTATGSVDIPNNSLSIAKVSGLQAELDSKLGSNSLGTTTYVLPRTVGNWILLGSFDSISQAGRTAVFEFSGNMGFDGDTADEYYATLRFCTSNGSGYTFVTGASTPFLGEATLIRSLRFASSTQLAIRQDTTTSFSFFLSNSVDPGAGAFFTVLSRSTFTYAGTSAGTTLTNVMFPTVLRDEGFDSTTQESIFMVGGALPTQTGSVRAHNFRSTTSDVLLKDNTSGTSNTRATFNSTKSIINSSLELDSGATTNLLVLKNSAGTNTIQVDTLNQLSFLNGTNNWLISNGNITTIKSNVYIGDTSSTSKTLTIDCPAAGGIPVLQLKCRNVSTTEVSLTNATWLFASKTNNLDIIFQTKNNSGTTSNVMTIDGGDAQVSFVNSIIVGGTTITSDRTLKDNIQDVSVDDCLHIFNNLKVKSFDWKRTGRPSLGFIAQEVEEILPQSNHYDIVSESKYQPTPDDEPMMIKTVDYTKLNTMLYVVIQEQQKRIDSLETRLANIEKLLCDTMNI